MSGRRRGSVLAVPPGPRWLGLLATVGLIVGLIVGLAAGGLAADWPQYMRDSSHGGDARNERLRPPLRLRSVVPLDDAILTAPAVVAGRVYVVDQSGGAYCVDPRRATVLWKTTPSAADSVGGNTSSPCVIDGTMAFGTHSGDLHLLDAATGEVSRSVSLGQPILGAITAAGGRFYLQTLDGIVHCLDRRGETRWRFDHYARAPREPGSRDKRQYSGAAVAVRGKTVVAAVGFDLVCLRDDDSNATLLWTSRKPLGDAYLPVGVSLTDRWVHASFPGKDGKGAVARFPLASGVFDRERDVIERQWAVITPPATRDGWAFFCRQAFGLGAARFGEAPGIVWSSFSDDPHSRTPAVAAPTLTAEHCIYTRLDGRLTVVAIGGDPSTWRVAQTLETPSGAVLTSSPAVSDGAAYFGGDDGCLYVVDGAESGDGAENGESSVAASSSADRVAPRRAPVVPAGERRYGWPSAFGGPSNANFVDDPAVQPPFRLRWATRCDGLFKQAVCATEQDLVYVTLSGLVECREQMTGRIRWRRHLPGQAWCRSSLLAAEERIFVPRMFSLRYPKSTGAKSSMYCLADGTGEILWRAPIGIGDRLRASPVHCDGVVAFGSLYKEGIPPTFFDSQEAVGQAVDAWDARTGRRIWRVELSSTGKLLNGPAGCSGDGIMVFTGGGEENRDRGETVAIEARTGRVLWRSPHFASQTGTPSYRAGRIYLPGAYQRPMVALEAETGKALWTSDVSVARWHVDTVSLGPDYLTVNNKYRGGAWKWDLATGTPVLKDGEPLQLWGPAHGCGAVVLTSGGHALSATIGGLCLTDVNTGRLAWNTHGFASYTCPHPIVANGRVFYAPQTSGMLFCFEPVSAID